MKYERIEEIKRELNDQEGVSLLMLQDLKKFVEQKIAEWGSKSGEQFRII